MPPLTLTNLVSTTGWTFDSAGRHLAVGEWNRVALLDTRTGAPLWARELCTDGEGGLFRVDLETGRAARVRLSSVAEKLPDVLAVSGDGRLLVRGIESEGEKLAVVRLRDSARDRARRCS